MSDFLDKLHRARSGAAVNKILEKAGSARLLQRSGSSWQQQDGPRPVGFPNDLETAKAMLVESLRVMIDSGAWTPAEPPKRGRPALADGAGKGVRIELRTSEALASKAQALADAAGVSRNAWIERLIERA